MSLLIRVLHEQDEFLQSKQMKSMSIGNEKIALEIGARRDAMCSVLEDLVDTMDSLTYK